MVSFDFVQASPATTWTISHGLNNANPNIDCMVTYLGVFQKVIPLTVVANDANTVTVTFDFAFAGTARVIA